MSVELPAWLADLRHREIVSRVNDDPRSDGGNLLGYDPNTAFNQILEGGQADFDAPLGDLSADDRALLYAYLLQKGHLEELTAAFRMLFPDKARISAPIVVDLGCGPFTGGLALAAALGIEAKFDYIGMDQSAAMRQLGERLALASPLQGVEHQWCRSLPATIWTEPPRWRPVIVIASYLLKSPNLNTAELVSTFLNLLKKIGRGPVTALYTNAYGEQANQKFPAFRDALLNAGFSPNVDAEGTIKVERHTEIRIRRLRYALFHRPKQNRMSLGKRT